jgi:agmatinase
MGGDHSVVLPILRSIYSAHGPIAVLHFDAHLDTWSNGTVGGGTDAGLTHGTYLHMAVLEGLIKPNTSLVCAVTRSETDLACWTERSALWG